MRVQLLIPLCTRCGDTQIQMNEAPAQYAPLLFGSAPPRDTAHVCWEEEEEQQGIRRGKGKAGGDILRNMGKCTQKVGEAYLWACKYGRSAWGGNKSRVRTDMPKTLTGA